MNAPAELTEPWDIRSAVYRFRQFPGNWTGNPTDYPGWDTREPIAPVSGGGNEAAMFILERGVYFVWFQDQYGTEDHFFVVMEG